jgi:hypothetical protein
MTVALFQSSDREELPKRSCESVRYWPSPVADSGLDGRGVARHVSLVRWGLPASASLGSWPEYPSGAGAGGVDPQCSSQPM